MDIKWDKLAPPDTLKLMVTLARQRHWPIKRPNNDRHIACDHAPVQKAPREN